MVYEHDPAMEAAYASQLLRAFRRAVEDPAPAQRFRFVIGAAPGRSSPSGTLARPRAQPAA